MLLSSLIDNEKTVFFCRYCGYAHENRQHIEVRKGLTNNHAYQCGHCGHKLHGPDLLELPRKMVAVTRELLESVEKDVFQVILARQLEIVRRYQGYDVVAWSLLDKDGESIRWRRVLNNSSTDYAKIRLQIGQGLAGKIVQYQQPLRLYYLETLPAEHRGQYPIMLCEDLKSAMVIPFEIEGAILGAILAGTRQQRKFSNEEMREFGKSALRAIVLSRSSQSPSV